MQDNYRRTTTTVSLINYHFVFCPYRRRKIFDIPGVEEAFKSMTKDICRQQQIEILALECHHDHVHLFCSALPTMSPADIMSKIKGKTSHDLRQQFEELSHGESLWTRSYFVSTAGNVSAETIQRYVETQKTRS